MSTSIHDYGVIAYLVVYMAFLHFPRLLYRNEQTFGQAETLRLYPQHRRIIDRLPRLTSGLTILLLMVIFATWLSPTYARATTIHTIGIGYGSLLVLDATFAWITGIRSINGLRPRYVVVQKETWRPMLLFIVSLLYLATPIGFLLNS